MLYKSLPVIQMLTKVARPSACAKGITRIRNPQAATLQICCCSSSCQKFVFRDNSVMIVATTISLAQTNFTYCMVSKLLDTETRTTWTFQRKHFLHPTASPLSSIIITCFNKCNVYYAQALKCFKYNCCKQHWWKKYSNKTTNIRHPNIQHSALTRPYFTLSTIVCLCTIIHMCI